MIRIGISSSLCSPIHCIFAIIKSAENVYVIPNNTIIHTEWGQPISENSFVLINDDCFEIDISWISMFEKKVYRYNCCIGQDDLKDISSLLIGCTLLGKICIWNYEKSMSQVLLYDKGYCMNNEFSKLFQKEEYLIEFSENDRFTIDELCYIYQKELYDEYGIETLDSVNIDELMSQYSYRYFPILNLKNENESIEFKYIEELLNDGTFDRRHDQRLLKEHMGAIPQKLVLKWDVSINEYIVFLYFEYDFLSLFFEKFYGIHKNTKTDFIIRINPDDNIYGLSLFRQGLSEPLDIPEEAYQLIVFKNNFEVYRSDNYNQERGAWIW